MSAPLRVLDIDLDAFVDPAAHHIDGNRLDPHEHSVWSADDALEWPAERCRLDAPRPGWAGEHHDELFDRWRDAITAGAMTTPFHVTHVDAHADLCHGANGYRHLLTDIVHHQLAERTDPDRGHRGLHEGNYLAYAVGCRCVADIDYVYDPGGGGDFHSWFMDGFYDGPDVQGSRDTIHLPHLTADDVSMLDAHGRPKPAAFEPPVSIRSCRLEDFKADSGYDIVCLCRSPEYTPATADALYDAIRDTFVAAPPRRRTAAAGG